MKIELKNLKINLAFSEETTNFIADIFVDGIKVGYAKNDGQGGCTGYHPYEGMNDLLHQAEDHAKTLPSIFYDFGKEKREIKSNLEMVIDGLVEDSLNAKEKMKHQKKLLKSMEKNIVWGKPNGDSFKQWGFNTKHTLKELLAVPHGKEAVAKLFDKVKAQLEEGEEIFNKDLIDIFK